MYSSNINLTCIEDENFVRNSGCERRTHINKNGLAAIGFDSGDCGMHTNRGLQKYSDDGEFMHRYGDYWVVWGTGGERGSGVSRKFGQNHTYFNS